MEELLKIFKAAADPMRLRILRMLGVKPLCVCEVMSVLGVAQSTASKHLGILAEAGLAEPVPGGVWTVYRLAGTSHAAGAVAGLVEAAAPSAQTRKDAAAAKGADRNRLCRQKIERRIRRG